jgi:hypothetical protein
MSNCIRISLEFSFKGETFAPSAVIDLDGLGDHPQEPDWHALLAKAAGIDTHSYAYEVMQQAELQFSGATGFAAGHLHKDGFDYPGFVSSRRRSVIPERLREIAREVLGVDDLDEQPALAEALLQAYRFGGHSPTQ